MALKTERARRPAVAVRAVGQKGSSMDIREHMEIVGSDGKHVGTVDGVEGDRIKLKRDGNEEGNHYLGKQLVDSVEAGKVALSIPAVEAEMWSKR